MKLGFHVKFLKEKNTKVNIPDFIKKDYDNKNHKQIIHSADVSYIFASYDALQNFVYLSIVINNCTKEIEGLQLSLHNDAKLIIDLFDAIREKLAG